MSIRCYPGNWPLSAQLSAAPAGGPFPCGFGERAAPEDGCCARRVSGRAWSLAASSLRRCGRCYGRRTRPVVANGRRGSTRPPAPTVATSIAMRPRRLRHLYDATVTGSRSLVLCLGSCHFGSVYCGYPGVTCAYCNEFCIEININETQFVFRGWNCLMGLMDERTSKQLMGLD